VKAALLGLCLIGAAGAAPYAWTPPISAPYRAPSDLAANGAIRGASLQGALVDIRYGQAAIDLGGVSEVLDAGKDSLLTLDGRRISAEALVKHLSEDLAVAVRYAPDTGKVGWLDAFRGGAGGQAGVKLRVDSSKAPAFGVSDTVALALPAAERRRLGGGTLTVTIPGVVHDLPLLATPDGGAGATVRVLPGWDYSNVPVFVNAGGKAFRGPNLSFSTTPPAITGFGPRRACSALERIPGWVDARSDSKLLDPSSARLTVSKGARVIKLQPRIDRTVFQLETDGPGEYTLDFSIADRMGRRSSKRWSFKVLPGP
jgi:hypothetical protein